MVVDLMPSKRPIAIRLALYGLSCLVLTGLCVAVLDRPIATWSHDVLHRPAAAVAITKLAAFRLCMEVAGAALAGALGMRLVYGRLSPPWRTAMAAAFATILAALAVMLLKHGFGRLWPETWVNNNPSWIGNHRYGFVPFHGGEAYGSFPSGHTARITAPFAVLWQRLPRWRLLWAVPPVAIAAALLACDYHFLGDCVAGAYVGIACAAAVVMFVQPLPGRNGRYLARSSRAVRMRKKRVRQGRVIFLYGFAKNEKHNIGPDELASLQEIAASWLAADSRRITAAIEEKELQEVIHEEASK